MPIYIGFGSIVVDDPKALTTMIMQAVRRLQIRAIVSRGWSNLGEGCESDENVFFLGDCPHEWLFTRVAAVVHHGGAGTTACGLLNGVPTFIVPFFGEYVLGVLMCRRAFTDLLQSAVLGRHGGFERRRATSNKAQRSVFGNSHPRHLILSLARDQTCSTNSCQQDEAGEWS